jgi:hypothetical protein
MSHSFRGANIMTPSQRVELEELAKLYARERPYQPTMDDWRDQEFDWEFEMDMHDFLGDWE